MLSFKKMGIFALMISIIIAFFLVYQKDYIQDIPIFGKKNTKEEKTPINDNTKTIKISAAGDCTIGWDTNFGYGSRLDKVFKDNSEDYGYFYKNVKDIFKNDDITYVNLEGTFTNSNSKVEKKFNFKAPPSFVEVLKKGNVEVVGIANNHSYDYGNQGFSDTVQTLKSNNIEYFGYENYLIKEVNDINVCFFGLIDIDAKKYSEVDKAINYFSDKNCGLTIAAMHWGIEKDYNQTDAQIKLGHYMIDNGVDLVLGSHPHVIQGIEKYNDKYIIYSLGNFLFGGNPNPTDKDTFIYQQTFTFKDGELVLDDNINILPAAISSTYKKNNYQPTLVSGKDAERVINKINNKSINFKWELKTDD